jgi:hypothetical protein
MQLGVRRLLDKVQSQSVAEFTDSEIDFFINRAYEKFVESLIDVYDETSTADTLLKSLVKEKTLELGLKKSETEAVFPVPEDLYRPLTLIDETVKYRPLKYLTFHSIKNDPFNVPNEWESWYKIKDKELTVYCHPSTFPKKVNLLYVKSFEKLKKDVTYTVENRKTKEYFPPEPLHYKIMELSAELIKISLNLSKESQPERKQ